MYKNIHTKLNTDLAKLGLKKKKKKKKNLTFAILANWSYKDLHQAQYLFHYLYKYHFFSLQSLPIFPNIHFQINISIHKSSSIFTPQFKEYTANNNNKVIRDSQISDLYTQNQLSRNKEKISWERSRSRGEHLIQYQHHIWRSNIRDRKSVV